MSEEDRKGNVRKVDVHTTDGRDALPQMPLKVVVAAELTPREMRTGESIPLPKRSRIDRQSFDEVMGSFGLRAFLDIPDRLCGSRDPLIIELSLPNLKSFRPGEVAHQIPAARDLLSLRTALAELRQSKTTVGEVKALAANLKTRSLVVECVEKALGAASGRSVAPDALPKASEIDRPSSSGAGLDSLLEMVQAPEGGGQPRNRADLDRLDAVVRHIVQSEGTGQLPDGRAVDAAISEIDAALSAQVDEVLHHPEFRRLESTWRGLRFLTDRTDFQEPISIEVIATSRDTLLPLFDELVHLPESQAVSEEPLSFVVVDEVFNGTPEDIDLLRALSERGAHLSVPVLVSAGPGLLGLGSAGELAKKTTLRETLEGPAHAKWRGLGDTGPSRWLGAIFNRFLLRPAYGKEGRRVREFDYEERLDTDNLRLWGNPVWALASLATRSFARSGWCTDIMGQRAAGTVEDLPVRLYERPGAETVSFPLETVISDAIERDLSNHGIMTLSAALNSDRASLRFAPSVHRPRHYQDPGDKARARLQSTLPYQMFVGRVLNYAMLVEGLIVPGRSAEQIQADYDRALRGLLGTAGPVPEDAVRVAVVPNEEDASQTDLQLRIRWPGRQSLPDAGDLELRWPLQG